MNQGSGNSGHPPTGSLRSGNASVPASKTATESQFEHLLLKFAPGGDATVAIVGMGYVGLPLAMAMHDAGLRVIAFDIDPVKVANLTNGVSYLSHLGQDLVPALSASPRFKATNDPSLLSQADSIILCVPTPLGKHQEPDLSYVENSTKMVASVLRAGQIVSLESTSYPGTTREICLPLLEASGLRVEEDFYLVFSPEREDPGRKDFETSTIPRLVGGIGIKSTAVGAAMYRRAVKTVIEVESAEVAEAAKLLENIYRAVNIALVNELKPVLMDMGIDIWSVIRAASTKPFGFQPFFPGPGLGGHCIPIDPYYLTYKAREYGHATRFIELAGEINHRMPRFVVERVVDALNSKGKAMRGSRILVLGIAYKPNVDDIRETPAAEVITLLMDRGGEVAYHDPHVSEFPSMRKYDIKLSSRELTKEEVRASDCIVIITDHAAIDWRLVYEHASLIVDTRDAMSKAGFTGTHIFKA